MKQTKQTEPTNYNVQYVMTIFEHHRKEGLKHYVTLKFPKCSLSHIKYLGRGIYETMKEVSGPRKKLELTVFKRGGQTETFNEVYTFSE